MFWFVNCLTCSFLLVNLGRSQRDEVSDKYQQLTWNLESGNLLGALQAASPNPTVSTLIDIKEMRDVGHLPRFFLLNPLAKTTKSPSLSVNSETIIVKSSFECQNIARKVLQHLDSRSKLDMFTSVW